MKEVPLVNGGVTLVDDEDYDIVMTRRWGKYRLPRHKTYYVRQTNAKGEDRKKGIFLHRWLLGTRDKVDHVDGDGLNNQRHNLRPVTNSQNLQNRQGLNVNNKTGVRGVCWDAARQKYMVTVGVAGRHRYLGRYNSIEEAEQAAIIGRKRHMTHSQN